MAVIREYLDPERKLVDEAVRWLAPRARSESSGAKSLSHVLVVVPTAQSARNLRFALAEAFAPGGVLPPRIEMSGVLLADSTVPVANEADETATLAKILLDLPLDEFKNLFPVPPKERNAEWALEMADAILGVAGILGEGALLMADVSVDEDAPRWRELKRLEAALHDALAAKKLVSRSVSRRNAARRGCCYGEIEEIVLPGSPDMSRAMEEYLKNSAQTVYVLVHAKPSEAGKFDRWGRPSAMFAANISPQSVRPAPSPVVEADDIARNFREVAADEALPALAVCDAEMYPELEGAFQNYFDESELCLRNPSRESFARSALGRLMLCMLELAARGDYETFSTFVRMGDVARWASNALGVPAEEIAEIVGGLDGLQNEHLPRTLDDVARYAALESPKLANLAMAIKAGLSDTYSFLRQIFSSLVLDERESSDRELAAAAKVVRDLREECGGDAVPGFLRAPLYARLLKRATYMLEPDSPHVLAALGWLEISWCPEDEIEIAGFNEGCVPENIVGHPFVPDSLRAKLGLYTNDMRAMRDSFIFAEATRCRAPGAVRVHMHQIASDNSAMKPSRILFNGISDEDLPGLAMRLYAVTEGGEGAPDRKLPKAWRLDLPVPPKGTVWRDKISATLLDGYRRCPFEFFLDETFKKHSDDRNSELDSAAFGSLCHAALDDFAKSAFKDSCSEKEIGDFLEGAVQRRLVAFGDVLPVVIGLQGEAAIARLRSFARIQAARRKSGWRIIAAERPLHCRIKDCPTLITGKVDRIDEHETTGELAIIDYKTWPRINEKHLAGIQLPLYRAMVEASKKFPPERARRAKAFYCVLADRPEDTVFADGEGFVRHEGTQPDDENAIALLLERLAKGVFYPPGKDSYWRDKFGAIVWETPEEGICEEWLADQKRRLE